MTISPLPADTFTRSPEAPGRRVYEPPVPTNGLPLFEARRWYLLGLDGMVTALQKMRGRLTAGMTDAKFRSPQRQVERGKHMPQSSIDDLAAAESAELRRLLKFGARTTQDRCRVHQFVDEQMTFQDSLRNRTQTARPIPPAVDARPSGAAAPHAPPTRAAAAQRPLPPTAGGLA